MVKKTTMPTRKDAEKALDSVEDIINRSSRIIPTTHALSEDNVTFLTLAFRNMMISHFGLSLDKATYVGEELTSAYTHARIFAHPKRFMVSAILHFARNQDIPHKEAYEELEISVTPARGKSYLPFFHTEEHYDHIAMKMAKIIQAGDRAPINFNKILDSYRYSVGNEDYEPQCQRDFVFIDTGTSIKQNGSIVKNQVASVIETKKICSTCPLQEACLASSIASPQNTRMSLKERTIPRPKRELLTVIDFLMFGGYTPQERKKIFYKVCDILEDYDRGEVSFDA